MHHRFSLVIAVLLAFLLGVPVLAAGTVVGGPHDFSNVASNYQAVTGTGDEVCKACHVPHNAKQDKFLWARDYNAGGTWTATTSSTVLCLGCHDGTLASTIPGVDSVDVPTDARISGSGNHPTGANAVFVAGGEGFQPTAPSQLPLENGNQVGCGTCHDPHGNGKMLRMSNTASALCVACHAK